MFSLIFKSMLHDTSGPFVISHYLLSPTYDPLFSYNGSSFVLFVSHFLYMYKVPESLNIFSRHFGTVR